VLLDALDVTLYDKGFVEASSESGRFSSAITMKMEFKNNFKKTFVASKKLSLSLTFPETSLKASASKKTSHSQMASR
jgi:hypothetical protein